MVLLVISDGGGRANYDPVSHFPATASTRRQHLEMLVIVGNELSTVRRTDAVHTLPPDPVCRKLPVLLPSGAQTRAF